MWQSPCVRLAPLRSHKMRILPSERFKIFYEKHVRIAISGITYTCLEAYDYCYNKCKYCETRKDGIHYCSVRGGKAGIGRYFEEARKKSIASLRGFTEVNEEGYIIKCSSFRNF